jgi:hypothetical protein
MAVRPISIRRNPSDSRLASGDSGLESAWSLVHHFGGISVPVESGWLIRQSNEIGF